MTPASRARPQQPEEELEPLRRVFTGFADETPAPASCPAPEQLWAAVQGELSAEEVEEVVDHTAACPSCAEEWRLARELARAAASETAESASAGGRVLRRGHRFWRIAAPLTGLAAAAVLLLVVGLPRRSSAPPELRAGNTVEIRSLLAPEETLARERCLLRWSEIEGAHYDVLVSDADLAVVAQVENLEQPQFEVPAESLARLPSGAELYWQVEAALPDGSTATSKTFVNRVE